MIPSEFIERAKLILGEECDEFIEAISSGNAVRGLRINPLKTDTDTFLKIEKNYSLSPIEYVKDGYIFENGDGIGQTPEHQAGMIYVQDPGAMSTLSALDIKPGWRVLDCCSAPGGKSSQAAAKIGSEGFLFSNEFVPKRAKITLGNFERLGIGSAILTSLDTSKLGDMFTSYFDLVIVDAPCSGEGMFRKSEEAVSEWSVSNIEICQRRQKEILNNVLNTVRAGGFLLYSTCTYAIEENEAVIEDFLASHTDFSLVDVNEELKNVTRPGITLPEMTHDMKKARRFYPHVARGEGQFIALMKRDSDSTLKEEINYLDASKEPSREEMRIVREFFSENLINVPEGRVRKVGDNLVLIAHGCPIPPYSVFMSGVLIGEIRKNILYPSHHFFSVYGKLFKLKERFSFRDTRANSYLRGEEIDAIDLKDKSGYCAILFEGAPIGGGKVSSGKIKNHYPKGLRNKK